MHFVDLMGRLRFFAVVGCFAVLGCESFTEGTADATGGDDDSDSTTAASVTIGTTLTTNGMTATATESTTAVDTSGDPTTDPTINPSTDPTTDPTIDPDTDTDSGPTTATETTATGSETSSSTGPDPEEGFGDCANNDATIACLADETCLGTAGFQVCALGPCTGTEDCPLPPTGGDAPVQCSNLDGMAGNECSLDCTGNGTVCPDGMICSQGICGWRSLSACIDRTENAVPSIEDVSTAGQGDDFVPTCATGNANDYVVAFDVPADGRYVFDTLDSPINTVISLIADDCAGAVIACNNDVGGGNNDSQLNADLMMGDRVLVVVDGSSSGQISLNIRLEGYGDCVNPPPDSCLPFETVCVVDDTPATQGVCIQAQNCGSADDCDAGSPTGGNAPVACGQVVGSAGNLECYLDCGAGQTCPTGMSCFDNTLCMWN